MPLYPDAPQKIRSNLELISRGERAPIVAIGRLSDKQFDNLNEARRRLNLHEVTDPEVLYIGRHHFESRTKDGYTIDDMVLQIESAMSVESIVSFRLGSMSTIQNPVARDDGKGNTIHDQAVFEATARKPKVELFSVIPRGDGRQHDLSPRRPKWRAKRHKTQKAHPVG